MGHFHSICYHSGAFMQAGLLLLPPSQSWFLHLLLLLLLHMLFVLAVTWLPPWLSAAHVDQVSPMSNLLAGTSMALLLAGMCRPLV